jgi:hypothetical protein
MELGPDRRSGILSPLNGNSSLGIWRHSKVAGLGLLFAFGGLAASCASSPPPSPSFALPMASAKPPSVASAPPAPCAAEYSALLDLAELARRYGPSAGVFLDPLGDMFEQLDECLTAARDGARPASAGILEISTSPEAVAKTR